AEAGFDLAAQRCNLAAERVVCRAEEISVGSDQGGRAVHGLMAKRACVSLDVSESFGKPGLAFAAHGVIPDLIVDPAFGTGRDSFDGVAEQCFQGGARKSREGEVRKTATNPYLCRLFDGIKFFFLGVDLVFDRCVFLKSDESLDGHSARCECQHCRAFLGYLGGLRATLPVEGIYLPGDVHALFAYDDAVQAAL